MVGSSALLLVFVLAMLLSGTLLRRWSLLLTRSAAVFAVLVLDENCCGGAFNGASCDIDDGCMKLFMLFIADATSSWGAEILRDIICDAVSICIETSLISGAGAGIAAAADIARGGGII